MNHIIGPRYELINKWVNVASAEAVVTGLTYTELLEGMFFLSLIHAKQVINEDSCPTCPKEEQMTREEADNLLQDLLDVRDQFFNNPPTKSTEEYYRELREKVVGLMVGEMK